MRNPSQADRFMVDTAFANNIRNHLMEDAMALTGGLIAAPM
jgi:hypothetical protein